MQMVDVYLPTTDGGYLILPRYTQPDPDQRLLLSRMKLGNWRCLNSHAP